MDNEFGMPLDRNGYSRSIMQSNSSECWICKCRNASLQRHEIFNGNPNRTKSKRYGLWVSICPQCHRRITDEDSLERITLKRIGQSRAMQMYEWDEAEFRDIFGRSYL